MSTERKDQGDFSSRRLCAPGKSKHPRKVIETNRTDPVHIGMLVEVGCRQHFHLSAYFTCNLLIAPNDFYIKFSIKD